MGRLLLVDYLCRLNVGVKLCKCNSLSRGLRTGDKCFRVPHSNFNKSREPIVRPSLYSIFPGLVERKQLGPTS